ncbi:MAG: 50S ribosomal protein L11 methyltransferase [Ruthenibacterium sp.]
MEWTDLKTTVPADFAEIAENIATEIAGGGIYIEDYRDLETQVQAMAHVDLIEQDLLLKSRTEVIIHLYIAPDTNFAKIAAILQDRLQRAEVPFKLETLGVRQEDWESGWKAYYHPLTIGERLAIVPSWEPYETDRIVITLDPGMAFGTGTHETTALCLAALDTLVQGGERVLDIGTGSGILAIAALKLGASEAEGVDIDPMCVRTAGENAALNGVAEHFKVLIGDLSDKASGTYDIICANIVANAIKSLVPCVPVLLKKHGIFMASGIIDTRKDEVIAAIEATGLAVVTVKEEHGWVALLCRHEEEQ